jgi:ribosomal-protein-alanine N-acetyltransferase
MAREVDTLVRTERLDLVLMPRVLLDALVAGDREAVAHLAPYRIPDGFPSDEQRQFLRFRRDQLSDDPSRYPWSVRAIVLRREGRMVGFVNFHGAPGVNDRGEPGALELGWTVFPSEQRRGYATETALALMAWATREYGIQDFISSTTPENAASLRVHDKLGFRRTGEVIEGELIFERRGAKD